ncbi:MAG: hypothetical protein IPI39_04520 [Candidatus Obscuribacter sp.]|nr:hypothetical protein [Candidatus Obscuribacter sp.]
MTSRAATHTIKRLSLSIQPQLEADSEAEDDDEITLEGLIEDVEILSNSQITAIQCKYHGAQEAFNLSALYKPLLQMMRHFKDNPSASIKYRLHAHFPNQSGTRAVTQEDLKAILSSTDKTLKVLIKDLANFKNFAAFTKRLEIVFGESLEDLMQNLKTMLKNCGLPEGEIDSLSYPNAIQLISQLSILDNLDERKTCKKDFLSKLHTIRKTAVSKWTLELKSKEQILKARRGQLKSNLGKNVRSRAFLLLPAGIDDFDSSIVLFISEFCDKYHSKPAHLHTPLFCIDVSDEKFNDIKYRLFQKGVIANDGVIGQFDETFFLRKPMTRELRKEFSIRLVNGRSKLTQVGGYTPDDLFIIGAGVVADLNFRDTNTEELGSRSISEIKYLLGLSNTYE